MDDATPLHLAGNHAPVAVEVDVGPTEVVGRVPGALTGTFVRNGPNPRTGWSRHLFDGDGMVHAVRIEDGAVRSYRNRWVRTPRFEHPDRSFVELALDPATGRLDPRVTTANTHVLRHAGRLLALEEGGLPYELSSELDTVGPYDFGGRLGGPMTAHPKVCPRTRELFAFGYRLHPPFATVHRIDAAGALVASRRVDLPCPSMLHDFAVTASRMVLFDSPIVFDVGAAAAGRNPWAWDDEHPARIGVVPRDLDGLADPAPVRWFEVAPGHLSHTVNAHDDDADGGDRLVLDGIRLPRDHDAPHFGFGGGLPRLHRWTIDLASGRVAEEAPDDLVVEYPRVPDDVVGRRHPTSFAVTFSLEAEPDHSEVVGYAADSRGRLTRRVHRLPPGRTCGEAVPVRGEDGATYLLTFGHDRARGTSYLLVLDADDLTGRPRAEVHLPVRVPDGFHGSWLPG